MKKSVLVLVLLSAVLSSSWCSAATLAQEEIETMRRSAVAAGNLRALKKSKAPKSTKGPKKMKKTKGPKKMKKTKGPK